MRDATTPATRQPGTPYLVVEGLKKHYGDGQARVQVLDGVTTTVRRGEICVMLGPSGSGKSTFLNLIGGLESADGGHISVGGCDLTALSPKQLGEYRRRELGFVFQFYNLVPDLTVRENIEVTAYLSDNPLPMDDLLASLGLWEQRDKFPRQGLHDRHGDAQRRHRGHGDARAAPARRTHRLRRGERTPTARPRPGVVAPW